MTRNCDCGLSKFQNYTIANRDVFSSSRMKRVCQNETPDDAERAHREQGVQRAQSAPIEGLYYRERQTSEFSQTFAWTASTEYSLWKDPDLEGKL